MGLRDRYKRTGAWTHDDATTVTLYLQQQRGVSAET
jgi:hypothetical protein